MTSTTPRDGTLRVGYVALAPFISGAERSLQLLVAHGRPAGIHPVVLAPPGSPMTEWCATHAVEYAAVDLTPPERRRPWSWLRRTWRLRRLVLRFRLDLLHSNQHMSYRWVDAAARGRSIARVCHVRDGVSTLDVRYFFRHPPDLVVCVSQHAARQLGSVWPPGHPRTRVVTLLNPVELPVISGGQDDARTAFGLEPRVPTIGFIGQLREVKGLTDLLDALALIRAPWQLLVAGADPLPGRPYEAVCRTRIEELGLVGRVRFAGFLDDTSAFYHAVDVVAVPSRAEPLGRVPLEAGAWGKPAVACAVGGLPETIVNGVTGWLVPAGDLAALASALEASLDVEVGPARGAAARRHVEAHHAPGEYAARMCELYQQILGR